MGKWQELCALRRSQCGLGVPRRKPMDDEGITPTTPGRADLLRLLDASALQAIGMGLQYVWSKSFYPSPGGVLRGIIASCADRSRVREGESPTRAAYAVSRGKEAPGCRTADWACPSPQSSVGARTSDQQHKETARWAWRAAQSTFRVTRVVYASERQLHQ